MKRLKNSYSIYSDPLNKIIIISAPSGAGKSTIVKALLKADLDLEFSISACSREKREGEIDGVHYYFISIAEFKRKIRNNEFIEWEEVYKDHFYGTLKSELDRVWNKGKTFIIDVDVYGGINVKKQFGKQALSLFIKPPDIQTLEERLFNRSTDKTKDIQTRLAKAREELTLEGHFDRSIINDDLETAVKQAIEAVRSFIYDD